MTDSGTLPDSLSRVDTLAAGGPQERDCQIEVPSSTRRYRSLVIIAFALHLLSAALFIGFVNRPVYDDQYNVIDVETYAHQGLSVATVRSQRNPPGPSSFLWMAAGVRLLAQAELRDARIANLISWVLLFVGILIGARYGNFPRIWYGALLAALVFPHAVMAAATTLTEGPALLFAILGTLAWIESAWCPTVTASSFLLQILAAFFMGIAISCRQYYLALLPAVALFGLFRLRGLRTNERMVRLAGMILSLSVASAPVILLIVVWRGLTSPGVASGLSHPELGWKAYAGWGSFRPMVAGFYSCFYLAPLTFPVVWRARLRRRWLALLAAVLSGTLAACFAPSLIQPGPLRALIALAARLPAGEFLFLACVAALTAYNAIVIGLLVWQKRHTVLSCPAAIFALLTVAFFILEQWGVGGNVPLYDRYLLQIAPFLGMIAFTLMPRLDFSRLLGLSVMGAVAHVILWSHAFER